MSHVDEGLIHAYLDGAFPPGSQQGEEIEAHLESRTALPEQQDLRP